MKNQHSHGIVFLCFCNLFFTIEFGFIFLSFVHIPDIYLLQDGIATLAKVEEAYRHEREAKEAIECVIKICSFYHLKDTLDTAEEGTDENRLLPAMNKIWPFLVVCIRNKNPVVRRYFL